MTGKKPLSDFRPGGDDQKRQSTPAANIVAEADKFGYDLIVMSTHGRTGIAHMLIGSVTEQVLRNAPCPVFSVHPPTNASEANS